MRRAYRHWMPALGLVGVLVVAMFLGPTVAERIAYAAAEGKARAQREQLVELARTDTLSPLFRAVAEVVSPAVVEIEVTKRFQGQPMDEMLRRFFEGSPFGAPGPQGAPREYFARGVGSGVIVDAENGYVITNYHVVGGADEVEILLWDGRKVTAEWVRTDMETDLAVVKIDADGLIEAPLGDSDAVAVGDWVLAFGSPRGLEQTVTAGIVSAKGREYGGLSAYQNSIQTDAAINRGNSGGPLVNTRGEVIGINNAIASSSGGNEGIGFAIASNMVRDVMAQLVSNGKVTRGYLGIRLQDIDEALARSFKLPHTEGALVAGVEPGKPAAEAGMEAGDFITAIDGRKIGGRAELQRVVAGIAPGTAIAVTVIRDSKDVPLTVTLAARPGDLVMVRTPPPADRPVASGYGLSVQPLTPKVAGRLGYDESVKGILIVGVVPGSEAAEQGVAPGMVVTHVQGQAVTTVSAFAEALAVAEDGEGVRLRVQTPHGGQRFVMIEAKRDAHDDDEDDVEVDEDADTEEDAGADDPDTDDEQETP